MSERKELIAVASAFWILAALVLVPVLTLTAAPQGCGEPGRLETR